MMLQRPATDHHSQSSPPGAARCATRAPALAAFQYYRTYIRLEHITMSRFFIRASSKCSHYHTAVASPYAHVAYALYQLRRDGPEVLVYLPDERSFTPTGL